MGIFVTSKKIELDTNEGPHEVMRRLQECVGPDSFSDRMSNALLKDKFVGSVSEHTASIRYLSGIRNSLQPTMQVVARTTSGGTTKIEARYSVTVLVKIFLCVWMFGATASSLGLYSGRAAHASGIPLFGILFPLFGVVLILVMRFFAKSDEQKLEQLLRDVVSQNKR